MLRERDLGRGLEGSEITLGEFLDRWLETAAQPKLREKSYKSYKSLLHRYVRDLLGARVLSSITPLDVQAMCQQMIDRGLSSRTVRYTHSVLRSAMRQAVRWRLLVQDPTGGAQLPRHSGPQQWEAKTPGSASERLNKDSMWYRLPRTAAHGFTEMSNCDMNVPAGFCPPRPSSRVSPSYGGEVECPIATIALRQPSW
jgi:hypothetical protein